MSEVRKDQMMDLLADRAIVGLSDNELLELAKLEKEFPEFAGDESFEEAAAFFSVAVTEEEEMPSHLMNIILDDGEDFVDQNHSPVVRQSEVATEEISGLNLVGWLGWAVAGAASLLLAFTFLSPAEKQIADVPDEPRIPTISEKRNVLLASADKISADWEATDKAAKISGDVVWSDTKQEGYMTFEGLPVNDKSKETYQLWIFDENQSDKTPVDGGIFDVSKDGKVTVPIDPKLKVKGAKMFAITIEKPGGVVVSDREKLILLGKV